MSSNKNTAIAQNENITTIKPNRRAANTAEQKQHRTNSEHIRIKIISIGDKNVGKSCLIKKYCEKNRFVSNYIPTIGVDYGVKPTTIKIEDGKLLNIKIDFYDFSGEKCINGKCWQ